MKIKEKMLKHRCEIRKKLFTKKMNKVGNKKEKTSRDFF